MTSGEVIRVVRKHVERQFPKTCNVCGVTYPSLVEYLRGTRHVGDPISFDAEMGDDEPWRPAGTLSMANCRCGNTLAIGSHGMSLVTMWRLLRWAGGEARRRGITKRQLLAWVRAEIDQQVLAEAPAAAAQT